MINVKKAFADITKTIKLLQIRGVNKNDLIALQKVYNDKNNSLKKVEKLRHQIKTDSQKFLTLKNDTAKKKELVNAVKNLKIELNSEEKKLDNTSNKLSHILGLIPNIPDSDIYSEWDLEIENKVTFTSKHTLKKADQVLDHWEFLTSHNLIDSKTTVNFANNRLVTYKNQLAYFRRALINFMMDVHIRSNKYHEIVPPIIVNEKALINTGHLPKFAHDIYQLNDDRYLIPTSEVSLVNFFAHHKFKLDQLPYKLCAFSECFRKEAGASGKMSHGLLRNHQFSKVELVWFCHPDNVISNLMQLVNDAEFILKLLDVPYRIVLLNPNDISHASSITYDLEVWMPSLQRYVEISSCSNCTDFQSNNSKTVFVNERQKNEFVYILNGTGVAVDRLIAAIVENHQFDKKNVFIPLPLQLFFIGKTLFNVDN